MNRNIPLDAIVLEAGEPPIICKPPYKAKDWPSIQMTGFKVTPRIVNQSGNTLGFSPERKAWESRSELLPSVRLPVTYPPHPGYKPIGYGFPALAFVLGVLAVPLALWLLATVMPNTTIVIRQAFGK